MTDTGDTPMTDTGDTPMAKPRDIRLITEPSVFLVGVSRPTPGMASFFEAAGVDDEMLGTEADTTEQLIEVAGRLCYRSFNHPRPGGWDAYLRNIVESRHGSVLEHVCFNFIITGVSRSFTHELVRHRVGWSYSQLSQRYVDSKDVAFVVPPYLRAEILAARTYLDAWNGVEPVAQTSEIRAGLSWIDSCWKARQEYAHLASYLAGKMSALGIEGTLARKRAREAARSVLPNATETWIFATSNVRSLRHFVELRSDRAADAEMRKVADQVARMTSLYLPWTFDDYELLPTDDATPAWITENRKI